MALDRKRKQQVSDLENGQISEPRSPQKNGRPLSIATEDEQKKEDARAHKLQKKLKKYDQIPGSGSTGPRVVAYRNKAFDPHETTR